MRTITKALLSSTLAFACAAPALAAAYPTLTCTDPGDGITFTAPVLQLYADTSKDFSSFYFSVHTDFSKYNEALHDEYLTSYSFDSCIISHGNGTVPENVAITDVDGVVTPQGSYVQMVFTFTTLSLGPESSNRTMSASKPR